MAVHARARFLVVCVVVFLSFVCIRGRRTIRRTAWTQPSFAERATASRFGRTFRSRPSGDVDTETDTVFRWRLDELTRAGYTVAQAEGLARSRCDLHQAMDLLKRGCDRETAFDILSDEEAA